MPRRKAPAICRWPTIRGCSVDALNGDPGVYTADWAGVPRDFSRAMQRVENLLQAKGAISPGARRGSFNATLCLAHPDGTDVIFAGKADGTLVWPPRGTLGFGYDPVFIAGRVRHHVRRDEFGRQALVVAGQGRSQPSRPRLRATGRGLL